MSTFKFTYKQAHFAAAESGHGPAVLFLHGFLENSSMWQGLVNTLPKSWRKITLDLPGHGDSDNLGYCHSMEEMAGVVKALLEHLGLRKVVLVGHSMGGYVALAFAEKHPDLVKALVLMNSTARADSEERKRNRDRAIAVVKRSYKSYIRSAIPMLFRPKNRKALREEVNRTKEQALQTSQQGVIAALEGMKSRIDREVLLHFGAFPVYMIAAQNDPVIPFADSLEQIKSHNLPHLITKDGHMSHLENFEELQAGLRSFLRQLR